MQRRAGLTLAVLAAVQVSCARQPETPEAFDWKAHNELRHQYADTDPRKSHEQSDIILQHSVMDPYIVSILSGWQLDRDPQLAIVNLLQTAERYPDLRFVVAACRVKAGDLYKVGDDHHAAKRSYALVLSDERPGLTAYRQLAEMRLRTLYDGTGRPPQR
jgi:hypothetical protein